MVSRDNYPNMDELFRLVNYYGFTQINDIYIQHLYLVTGQFYPHSFGYPLAIPKSYTVYHDISNG